MTGFCMGGALSIASGVLIPEVDAVVSFYGIPSPQLADVSKIKVPVQAHFGELDNIAGFSDVKVSFGYLRLFMQVFFIGKATIFFWYFTYLPRYL